MSFEILFFLFSSVLLTSALVVISARNPIHSVLFLILVFVNVIFILIHLEVEYLALTFVIVYVGAVAVLFLFVVMMRNTNVIRLNREIVDYFSRGVWGSTSMLVKTQAYYTNNLIFSYYRNGLRLNNLLSNILVFFILLSFFFTCFR